MTHTIPDHLARQLSADADPFEIAALDILFGLGIHDRPDFRERYLDEYDGGAAVDWLKLHEDIAAGHCILSSGEQRALTIACSIADGTPVSLNVCLGGIDRDNQARVVKAIAYACGVTR